MINIPDLPLIVELILFMLTCVSLNKQHNTCDTEHEIR